MKRPVSSHCRRLLSLFLLTIAPGAQAGERGLQPHASPYRLATSLASEFSVEPYQLDRRYRLASAADARLADKPFANEIDAAARDAGLDPALVHALVAVESAYQPSVVSPKGAVGLMQLLPETARRYGVTDPARVNDNLRAGTRHLRGLLEMFDHRVDLALAAYNAGEGAVRHYDNSVPPYPETRHYVPAVIGKYRSTNRGPVLRSAIKPPVRDYLPGTRLESAPQARLP